MSGELGKASLDLEANLEPFRRDMAAGRESADDMSRTLDALAAVSKIAEDALKQVKMGPTQSVESKTSAEAIIEGVRGVSDEARTAARELDRVRITDRQAAESDLAGEVIKANVKDIGDEADRTKRKLEEVKVASAGGGMIGGTNVGFLGAAIGAGALVTPAAGPAVVGLLGAIPVLAGAAAGSVGALALAFDGVFKAISGNKKAFDDLGPAAQQFVLTIRSLDGTLDHLRQTAAANLFPGLTEGLKSALSPGTLNAVTQAIAELARALGEAGAAWGKYFGSAEFQSIFGPLMHDAATQIGTLSDTLLHLFDALGIFARAAIPFTDWLTSAFDKGAKLVDQWLHAKDASGQLAGGLNEAKTSLELVWRLFESLVNAVGALGSALYPISKVAVKDLTDGFNTLAGIIDRNKETIQAIVGGALSALVQIVKLAYGAVTTLITGFKDLLSPLQGIVNPANAVKDALEAIVALKLANALFTAATGTDALGKALLALKSNPAVWAVIIALGAVAAIKGLAGSADTWNGVIPPGSTPVDAITGQRKSLAQQVIADQKKGMTIAQIQEALAKSGHNDLLTAQAFTDAKILKSGGGSSSAYYSESDLVKMLLNAGASKTVALNLAAISAHGEDPSGNPRALNNNPKTGDYSAGLFQENFYAGLGPSRVKEFAPMFGLNPNMPVKQFVSWLQGHPDAQAKIALAQYKSQGYSAWTTAAGLGITDATSDSSPFGTPPPWSSGLPKKPAIPTGAALLPEGLRNQLQTTKDNATSSSGSVAAMWLHAELADLNTAKSDLEKQLVGSTGKKRAAIEQELRTIDGAIASVNQQITSNLKSQAQAIKTSFQSQISTAKANISSALSELKATLDAQFQAATQKYIDNTLSPKYFQGNDPLTGAPRQTPLEAKLAAMQAADTDKQLSDAVNAAEQQLEQDRQANAAGILSGSSAPGFEKVDQDALAAAKRQLDEYNLSINATKERQQADADYAAAVQKYQADRAEAERQMNLQLDDIAHGLATGTQSLGDLQKVVDSFGLSLTADGGVEDDFTNLQKSVQALGSVYDDEAVKLAGLGKSTDGAVAALDALATKLGGQYGATAGDDALGRFLHNAGIPGFADGGIVLSPTLAMVGEAGPEAIIPLDGLDGDVARATHIHFHGGTFIGGDKQSVARDLKPYIEKIVTV